MTLDQLVGLLTGTAGCLVLSLVLNYLQFRGRLTNPTAVVPRADYEKAVEITARNTVAIEKIAARAAKAGK